MMENAIAVLAYAGAGYLLVALCILVFVFWFFLKHINK